MNWPTTQSGWLDLMNKVIARDDEKSILRASIREKLEELRDAFVTARGLRDSFRESASLQTDEVLNVLGIGQSVSSDEHAIGVLHMALKDVELHAPKSKSAPLLLGFPFVKNGTTKKEGTSENADTKGDGSGIGIDEEGVGRNDFTADEG